jgi:hypothetical protein
MMERKMGNGIEPQLASNLRQQSIVLMDDINWEIEQFNQAFNQEIPAIESFGGNDVNRISVGETRNALERVRREILSENSVEKRQVELITTLGGAISGIGMVDADLDERAGNTRNARWGSRMTEDFVGRNFDDYILDMSASDALEVTRNQLEEYRRLFDEQE